MMLSLLAAISAANPVPLPIYEPGDAFVFSSGRVERVISVADDRITWSSLTGQPYERSRNFIVPILTWRRGRSTGTREVRGNPDAIWPLDRPRSVRFRSVSRSLDNAQSTPKRSVSLWQCKSRKSVNLTVEAGTFDVIPVACDRYSSTTMRLLERIEWDYAPEVNHYIRRTTINYLRGTRTRIELVATLSGPSASTARLSALSRSARLRADSKDE